MKYSKIAIFSVFILLSLFFVTANSVANTLNGGTGLINIPSAEVLEEKELSIGYNHYKSGYLSLSFGVFPWVEAGVASPIGDKGTDFIGNLKVKLLEEEKFPAVAVGLEVNADKSSYYVVGSKQLAVTGLRGHFGLGTGRFSNGFAGISMVLNPVSVRSNSRSLPLTTMLVEYDGSNLNKGLLFQFNPEIHGSIFVSNLSDFGIGVNFKTRF